MSLQHDCWPKTCGPAPTAFAANGLTVVSGQVLRTQTFREGYCLVQDEASQLVAELVERNKEPGPFSMHVRLPAARPSHWPRRSRWRIRLWLPPLGGRWT